MSEHTPGPWRIESRPARKDENQVAIVRGVSIVGPYAAVSCGDEARFIVRACNAHDGLVAAAKAVMSEIVLTHSDERTFAGVNRAIHALGRAIEKAEDVRSGGRE